MSPERKKNLQRLRGISFASREDFQTWVFGAAALCLMAIAGYSVFQVASKAVFDEPHKESPALATGSSIAATLSGRLPDFRSIADVSTRKQAFFEFMRPYVDEANRQVLEDRDTTLHLKLEFESKDKLSRSEQARFDALREKYGLSLDEVPSRKVFERLLRRADVVPESLVLAQAALESGWGTSRFARMGNNLFGIWCYDAGCGIVPSRRSEGARHEVTKYASPSDCFVAYIQNLNTNGAYSDLRYIRAEQRAQGLEISGVDIAAGLTRYSEEGWDYVGKVQGVIRSNGLE